MHASEHPAGEPIAHPDAADIRILAVLRALGDPTRLDIVRKLARHANDEIACGAFGIDATKQNLTHHFRVLREAGVTRVREEGRSRLISLRRADLHERFPGLLEAILAREC